MEITQILYPKNDFYKLPQNIQLHSIVNANKLFIFARSLEERIINEYELI